MQTKEIQSLLSRTPNCAYGNLRKAVRLLGQVYDDGLRPHGVRGTQFTVLAHIAHLAPVTVTELAGQLAMDRTTLSRNLRPLIQAEWVATAPGRDRRVRVVRLTAAGQQKLSALLPVWQRCQEYVEAQLGQTALASLFDLTDAISGGMPPKS